MISASGKTFLLPTGQSIAYTEEGAGDRVLLFVHGLGTSSAGWMLNVPTLARLGFRCIAVDLPGNGASEPAPTYTMRSFATAILHLIGGLALRNVTIIGHSMGAQVSMEAMMMAPASIERAVLCAPAGLERFTEWERMVYLQSLHFSDWITSDEAALRRSLHSSFFHFPGNANRLVETLVEDLRRRSAPVHKAMLHACIRGMLEEPVLDRIPQIRQPVLILFGEMDALIPARLIHATTTRKLAEDAVKRFPAGKLKMIPRCGHFLQWEASETVNAAIRDWAAPAGT